MTRILVGLVSTSLLLLALFIWVGPPKWNERMSKLSRGLPPHAEDGFLVEGRESMIVISGEWISLYVPLKGNVQGVRFDWIDGIERNGKSYTIRNSEYENQDLTFTPAWGYGADAERVIGKVEKALEEYEVVEE